MAEQSFFFTDKERLMLFDYLQQNNCSIIPDMKYDINNYHVIQDSDEFLYYIENVCVGFFIISPIYSIYPLYPDRNPYFEEPAYFIKQRYGGPYIDIGLYRGYADDQKVKCKRTDVGHYRKFIRLQEEFEEFTVSEIFNNFYKDFIKYLKSISKVITVDNKKYFVHKNYDHDNVDGNG